MGLDMYLTSNGKEIGYWRKANQIHLWFVTNVQGGTDDCRPYPVSRAQLQSLLGIVERVLAASELIEGDIQNGSILKAGEWKPIIERGKTIRDASVAKELLPTESGFFFGSEDYDEYYIADLMETKEITERALREPETARFRYQSSW